MAIKPLILLLSDNMVIREEIEIEGIPIVLEKQNRKNLYLRIKSEDNMKESLYIIS